ncbi:MAG: YvcK family protein [Coriobacteriia bacterium]|nr:YvcK family protein [Coriobacteriia bacterium]
MPSALPRDNRLALAPSGKSADEKPKTKTGREAFRAVVIGGGTGAPVSIKALFSRGIQTDAVVAMADDGGSTGMLREHTGMVPPGDIRKCLVAMASNPESIWVKAFKQRFSYVNDHTLGNLILTALNDNSGSFPEAISLCEQLLDARGHVHPSTLEYVTLTGRTRDGRRLRGQATLCASQTALASVSLDPSAPQAFEPALKAIREADLIVLGPGSLFTSIIPNLLVPGVLAAIAQSKGTTVFLCSLADMQGETWGLTSAELVEALFDHGMRGLLDIVVVHQPSGDKDPGSATGTFAAIDPSVPPKPAVSEVATESIRRVLFNRELAQRIESQGPMLIVRDLVDPLRPTWHDVFVLSEVFEGVLSVCPSRRR